MTVEPKTAKVTETGGLVLTKVEGEEGKYQASVEFEQMLTLESELEGYDKIIKPITIGAEDKSESLVMGLKLVSSFSNCLIVKYVTCICFSVYLQSNSKR